jgi:hypothetical protein
MPDMDEMDKMMQEMFGNVFGAQNSGAPPDISNIAKLLG